MGEETKAIKYHSELSSFYQGIKDCIPTLIGYISIGVAAGVVGSASGLSVLEVGLLSALVYAGAAQFIFCALIASGSPYSAIVITVFIVNFRHFLLSMALAPQFTAYSLWKNIGIGSLLTDESFGVAITKVVKKESIDAKWMYGLNITAYVSWILSCTAGALFGKWISDPAVFGLDFALTAMFVALLVLQLTNTVRGKLKLYLSLIMYVAISMTVFCMFMPSHIAIILSTVIVAAIGVVMDR